MQPPPLIKFLNCAFVNIIYNEIADAIIFEKRAYAEMNGTSLASGCISFGMLMI